MKRCPVCRARFSGKPVCRRCKSDLFSLIQLEEQVKKSLHRAVYALAAGNIDTACNFCGYAESIKKTSFGKALSGFLASRQDAHRAAKIVKLQ
ncbi:MAG: hypothetical protein J7L69_00740 [Desulfobulbaceae bacterium]|nr:hypothetical protein [Desulfobulbaceae bacterium]